MSLRLATNSTDRHKVYKLAFASEGGEPDLRDMTHLIVERPSTTVKLFTLDRPERRNALSTALLMEVAAKLAEADCDGTVRTVVITGSATLFAAGADIDEIEDLGADEPVDGARPRVAVDPGLFETPDRRGRGLVSLVREWSWRCAATSSWLARRRSSVNPRRTSG